MNKKNLVCLFNNLRNEGVIELLEYSVNEYNIILIHRDNLESYEFQLLERLQIKVYKLKNIFPIWIEEFLQNFIIPLKTTNYKFGKKRDYFNRPLLIRQYLIRFAPKFLKVEWVHKLISLLGSEYDELLLNESIDGVFSIGFIYPSYISCRANRLGIKTISWIYSWDNPYKYNTLPRINDLYLVWGEKMKLDLHRLHKISLQNIQKVGVVQFDYLKQKTTAQNDELLTFVERNRNSYFLYLFCAPTSTANSEIEFFNKISKLIVDQFPEIKIVARLYPNIKDIDVYKNILVNEKIILDYSYAKFKSDITKRNVIKRGLIENSLAIINLGTTMAIEAAYFKKPIVQIAFTPDSEFWFEEKTHNSFNQLMLNEHLVKYYFQQQFINIVKTKAQLKYLINTILQKDNEVDVMAYSNYLYNLGFEIKDPLNSLKNHINSLFVIEKEHRNE